jgi:hypothetical protein
MYKEARKKTLTLNSSAESQEPIFNNAVKAGAAAEPNSRAEANKGSNCRNQDENQKRKKSI